MEKKKEGEGKEKKEESEKERQRDRDQNQIWASVWVKVGGVKVVVNNKKMWE